MHFLLGLDYELFLGERTGSVDRCLLAPTDAIARVMEKHGFRMTLFVDASYLRRLRHFAKQNHAATAALSAIGRQLRGLVSRGHDAQLHLHPHWEDCALSGSQWTIKTERYRLHDFPSAEIPDMLHDCVTLLAELAGCEVFAFRAGGWCLQPFPPIGPALRAAGIRIDSTVFTGGRSEDSLRWFDFSKAPAAPYWRFQDDPLIAEPEGDFLEVPISSHRLGPWFFWSMAIRKKLGGRRHKAFGDGALMQADGGYYLRRLTQASVNAVSMDGAKSDMLECAYRQHAAQQAPILNVIGHPKSLTPHALSRLDTFLARHGQKLSPLTFQQVSHLIAKGAQATH